MSLVAPGIAEKVRPGHFVALAVGGEGSGMLLRRAFSVYQARPTVGPAAPSRSSSRSPGPAPPGLRSCGPGPGRHRRPARPALPAAKDQATALLVGGGYGSAPLFALAGALHDRGCRVDMVLGAATESRLFGVLEAKRAATTAAFTTDDGSYGFEGRVSDVLDGFLERADVVYACGPMAMLQAVARQARIVTCPAWSPSRNRWPAGSGSA